MCHLCGEKSRLQTIPTKRKCSERTLAGKKSKTVNIRVTETYYHLREKETWRNQIEREIKSNRTQI